MGGAAALEVTPDASRRVPAPVSHGVGPMNQAAELYVRLALAVGSHDPDSVDAYYGPAEWKQEALAAKRPLAEIAREAKSLSADLDSWRDDGGTEMDRRRRRFLARQLDALAARAEMLSGKRVSFDEESRALYDAVAPVRSEDHYRTLRDRLETELPGAGPLAIRYEAFRQAFLIPNERLDIVFQASIAAARERTLQHIEIPFEESFAVEYVTDRSWSGYNWYQGGYRSLIQVNTDLPIHVDRAIDLACHEGYPGHHVYNVLIEKKLVRDRGWIEFRIYPLFSPSSLIAEGSANYGIEMAFPEAERLDFEKSMIYPLAGLDPDSAERYDRVRALAHALAEAGNEAARRLLDGRIEAKAAADWLTEYALMAPARAEQRVRFIEQYRSYVINYNLGKDLVRRSIEGPGGDSLERRWKIFEGLLSAPVLPSELAADSPPPS
ncbi:MAG TPA: hypothetical protein VMR54_12870 [Thermoanaerobaculia bacterium]|nr:hypothetical protein [Thermoanaerobaculia bacterium]